MYLQAIKVYCDVVKLKSFSHAAEQNGVTQSAASQHVSQLEKNLGVQLLDRSKRPFQITPEGKIYYEGCKFIVERYYAVENEVRGLRHEVSGTVRVSAIYSVGLPSMIRYCQEFSKIYPKATVQVGYTHPDRIYDKVLNNEADIGLVSYPEKRPGLQTLPWQTQPMAVICAPGHRFAARSRLRPRDIDREYFIAYDEGLAIRKELNRYLKKSQVEIRIKMAFDNIEAIKRAVEIGEGISIVPEITAQAEVKSGSLSLVRLVNPAFTRPIGIVLREGKGLLPAGERFVEFIQKKENTRKDSTVKQAA